MKIFAVVLFLTIGFCLLAFLLLSYISPVQNNFLSNGNQVHADTTVYFQPSQLPQACYKKQSADIFINSGSNLISSVQIELIFDPLLFSDFSISPAQNNFFGDPQFFNVNLLETRQEYGRASLSMELTSSQTQKQGQGKIATINFTANPQGTNSATISFLNKTTVMGSKSRISLLKSTVPLTIFCI